MRNGDAALRFSIVVAVASFIALTAGLYEIDRREKSTSATRERSLSEIEQRLQVLGDQIHILNNQLTAQMAANERQLQTLNSEVQALGHKYESRLKELEDALHVRR
jgi:peptidoglycan hydrolase CwlO-like protein